MSYATLVLVDSEVTFLREEEDVAFCPSLDCILFIYGIAKLKKSVIKFSSLPYFWGYFVKACSFSVVNFCHKYVKFSLCKLP